MQLLEFLTLTLLATAWINGIFYATTDGMILNSLTDWLHDKVGDFWAMPLFDCPYCMASFHGALVYFSTLALGWHSLDVVGVFLFIPVVCGVQVLIRNPYE